jgi:hypothetical protein
MDSGEKSAKNSQSMRPISEVEHSFLDGIRKQYSTKIVKVQRENTTYFLTKALLGFDDFRSLGLSKLARV